MAIKFANNVMTTIAAGISNSATSISLAPGDGAKFPALGAGDWIPAVLEQGANFEIVRITGRATDTLTVLRAQEGTSGVPFTTGARLDIRLTAGILDLINAVLFANVEDQLMIGGAQVTPKPLGNLNGATITPSPGARPIQKIINNGAGSILPGAAYGHYNLQIINASGAGLITTTGWVVKGNAFDTVSTSKFLCSCLVSPDMAVMTVLKVA